MYTPRTISSSVRLAQSSASRLVRKVLDAVGQPVFRMTAFQVPEGVLTIVAMRVEAPKSTLGASPLYRNCTWLANLENPPAWGNTLNHSKFLNLLRKEEWCPRPESNRHALRRGILSPLRLPIPPLG